MNLINYLRNIDELLTDIHANNMMHMAIIHLYHWKYI